MIGKVAKRLAFGFACVAVAAAPAWAEKSTIIPLTTSSTWRLVGSQQLAVDAVQKWGGDPAIEKECGVKSLVLRTYTLYPEDESVKVLVENAADVSSAYGLFTLYRNDSMTPMKGLALTEVGADSAVMARGNTFIRIVEPEAANPSGNGSGTEKTESPRPFPFTLSQLQTLLVLAGGSGPTADDLRGLPGALPDTGLIRRSEKYLLGLESAKRALPSFRSDLIGFSQGAEARMAMYRTGGTRVRVLAVTYPTPQIARQRFEAMESLLDVNKDHGASTLYGKLTGSFVILVLDASSSNSAEGILNQFKSTGYVTWNEHYEGDQTTVVQVVRLVLANLFLSFILAGFGLFGGILFFGSKYIARKWFPKSLWGQPDEATIIRLNLQ
jgi:Family of unknown function (DUF6599)